MILQLCIDWDNDICWSPLIPICIFDNLLHSIPTPSKYFQKLHQGTWKTRKCHLKQCWVESHGAQLAQAQKITSVGLIAHAIGPDAVAVFLKLWKLKLLCVWESISCHDNTEKCVPCMLFVFDFTIYTGYPVLYRMSGSPERRKWHFLLSFTFLLLFPHFRFNFVLYIYYFKFSKNERGITILLRTRIVQRIK